jgi:hypothetical protein
MPWRFGFGAAVLLCAGLAFPDNTPVTYPQCTRKPSAADVEGAKGAHRAATQFYDRGEYDRAIQYWRDAYAFDCTAHAVLINIANAYEKKGDKAAAVATLETYLVRDPRAPDAPNIAEKVNNLKNSLQQATPTSSATAPPPPAPTSTPTATPTDTVEPPPPPPQATSDTSRPFGVLPWVVVGVGGAALVAGVILLPVGLGKVSDAEAVCPNRKCPAGRESAIDDGNTGRTMASIGTAALIVGGVAVAGGLVWQLGFNRAAPSHSAGSSMPIAAPSSVRLVPLASPSARGVFVSGAF